MDKFKRAFCISILVTAIVTIYISPEVMKPILSSVENLKAEEVKENGNSTASSGTVFSGKKIRQFKKMLFSEDIMPPARNISVQKEGRQRTYQCEKWGVLTTIFPPSEAVRRFLYQTKWCLIIVGDYDAPNSYDAISEQKSSSNNDLISSRKNKRKQNGINTHSHTNDIKNKNNDNNGNNKTIYNGKNNNNNDNIVFLPREEQVKMESQFVDFLPWHSFGRKNIGYLFAIAQGAEVIWDFDDDNMLKFWLEDASPDPMLDLDRIVSKILHGGKHNVLIPKFYGDIAFNPYPLLGCPISPCWPRGFPLKYISNSSKNGDAQKYRITSSKIGILQSVADHEPDVDAIFRMTQGTPLSFNRLKVKKKVLILPNTMFSPLNAQATLHFKSSFFALYLPVTVAGRVSDIWRSYIAQTLFRTIDLRIGFLPRPIVIQDRNPHFLEADFNAEIPIYTKSAALLEFLNGWSVRAKDMLISFEGLVEDLFKSLYDRNYLEEDDVIGIQLWLQAINNVGYVLPKRPPMKKKIKMVDSIKEINVDVGLFKMSKGVAGIKANCQNLGRPKTFFSAELHVGTRLDVASQLASINQHTVLGGIKGREMIHRSDTISEYENKKLITFHENVSPILRKNSISNSAPYAADNFQFYRNDSVMMKGIDAFVCSFPAANCELWKLFNKSIVFLPAHRYNLGKCSEEEFTELNDWILNLSRDDRNVIGAMSRYDLEYMRYYLGPIPSFRLISSLSGSYTKDFEYNPSKKELLIVHAYQPNLPNHFQGLIHDLRQHDALPVYEMYPKFSLHDLVQHPAIILLPYSVMSYKLTEFYAMAIPLFVPSPAYFLRHGGLGPDRTMVSPPYCKSDSSLNGRMKKHGRSIHPYSPNLEFQEDPEAEMYWLQFSDFYEWPHIQLFDGLDDLVRKINSANLKETHFGMKDSYREKEGRTFNEWCNVIPKIG